MTSVSSGMEPRQTARVVLLRCRVRTRRRSCAQEFVTRSADAAASVAASRLHLREVAERQLAAPKRLVQEEGER